ncbi:MAG TPA: methyltransferase [Syntrophobacteraceae bacterium]|nr:methyltransferase [Syntrophobacteraceae bacterium]
MTTMNQRITRLRPPRVAICLLGVAGLIYGFFPAVRASFWICLWCGLSVFVPGAAVMVWAWAEFEKKDNPILPTDTPVVLICSGPFRFSRNPMYLGMLLMLLSPAIGLGAPLFLFPPVVFFVVINFVFIPYEEKILGDSFNGAFANYTCSVRRWV